MNKPNLTEKTGKFDRKIATTELVSMFNFKKTKSLSSKNKDSHDQNKSVTRYQIR